MTSESHYAINHYDDDLAARRLRSALLHLTITGMSEVITTELGRKVRAVDADTWDACQLLHHALVEVLPIHEPERSRAALRAMCGFSVIRQQQLREQADPEEQRALADHDRKAQKEGR